MNRNPKVTLALLLVAILVVILGFAQQSPAATKRARLGYETLFTVPIGDAGLHYSGIGPESRAWGPSSFRLANDETFWIADTPANRLVQFDRKGILLSSVEMPESLVAITDFSIEEDGFVILDASAPDASVYRITSAGTMVDKWELPSEVHGSITGIQSKNGDISIEQEGGAAVSRLVTNERGDNPALEKSAQGSAPRVELQGNTFSVSNGAAERKEQVQYTLARAVLLSSPSNKIIPVLVEEMTSVPTIHVDQTVWLYTDALRPIGRARVPLAEQYVYVERPVVVAPDGEIYALLTFPDHISIVKLSLSGTLHSVLSSPLRTTLHEFEGSQRKTCIDRSTMILTASAYLGNSQFLSTTNISGSCSGRKKPRYLTTAKNYSSVPYDWGGNDTISGFNSYMTSSSNNTAGDIDTIDSETCSRGVDCSGYVGRVWGKSTKYSTSTIPNISALLSSTSVLKPGDVVNKVGDHVALFYQTSSGGAYWYEATVFNQLDRVIYGYHPWSYFSGYKPRRSLDVCGGQSE